MKVAIAQFMMPDGRQVEYTFEISDDCEDKYNEILACGL